METAEVAENRSTMEDPFGRQKPQQFDVPLHISAQTCGVTRADQNTASIEDATGGPILYAIFIPGGSSVFPLFSGVIFPPNILSRLIQSYLLLQPRDSHFERFVYTQCGPASQTDAQLNT